MTKEDFKNLPEKEFSLGEQIREVVYELALRENAYPRFIERGQLKPADAQRHYQALKAVLKTLQGLANGPMAHRE
ncbi:hypothetical protein [Meiothermus sp. Pnk-1]|uniref:hypothetical protein n=1 Tax=Meiothermus sp. Pnk-1 TaxID=873128 RepID=UPI000D7CBBD9|nr:hypothetical protein [Meiothermus sp. Pnk-1]PZA08317.1 hypothetical protein DNA98_04050 [Meiothermus sp. Pnk-1]